MDPDLIGDDVHAAAVGGVRVSADDRRVLGRLLSTHTGRSPLGVLGVALVGVFTLPLAVLPVWLAAPALRGDTRTLVAAAASVVVAGPAFFVFMVFARKLCWRLAVCDRGLAFRRLRGTRVVLWGDVERLVATGLNADKWLKLRTADGRGLVIDSALGDFDLLSAVVRGRVTAEVLARTRAALARGEGVPFGPLNVTPAGLERAGRQPLAWEDVADIAVRRRDIGVVDYPVLVIRAKPSAVWTSERLGSVANLDAFLELAGRLTGRGFDPPGH